jgi:Nuclease-related domain
MRVMELSDHPGAMLKEAQAGRAAEADRERLRFEAALAQHRELVDRAIQARDQARVQRRWWAWLRGILAVRRERRLAPAAPVLARRPSDQEAILTAGMEGEQLTAASLGRILTDDWTLLRGYRNNQGEIDHLVLGPSGLFAIESKHRNATVYCAGDRWWYIKYDKYGNAVERGEMTDKQGRSPSRQLNEPADQLEHFLRSRGHPIAIQRIVLLTHSRSRLGNYASPTVHVTTSAANVIELINTSQTLITDDEQRRIERLIIRDHEHHQTRRTPAHDRPQGSRRRPHS